MVTSPTPPANPSHHVEPLRCAAPVAIPDAARRRCIPFRMLADAFGTEDEELEPEPDYNDFVCWTSFR